MPYYRKRRTISRSKRYRRKRMIKRKLSRVPYRNRLTRSVNPFKQMPSMWKLRYSENITLSTDNTGGLGTYAFAANSIYDPNVSGVGHQPLLHDQLAPFWQRYTVLGARITVKAVASSSSNAGGQLFGCVLDDNNSLQGPGTTLIENGKGSYRWINQNTNTSTKSSTLSVNFSAKKFFGKKNIVDDDFVSATFGNNPANLAYFILWTETPNVASFQSTLGVNVVIDYIVRCHEPQDIAQS